MNLDIFSISIKTVFAYSYRSLHRGWKHAFFPFGVLPHHISVCALTVSTGVEPASPERQSGVLAVILRDYITETGAFAHSPCISIQKFCTESKTSDSNRSAASRTQRAAITLRSRDI